jgi:predicted kinase
MAGESGTGKSTLARAIGGATGAVVLDRDYFKAPLMDEGLSFEEAGGLSYAVFFSVARSLLMQERSLILDSAAFYPSIIERGERLAAEAGAVYRVIECWLPDAVEHDRRLRERQGLVSQPGSLAAAVAEVKPGKTALSGPHLRLDTGMSLTSVLARALTYLSDGQS